MSSLRAAWPVWLSASLFTLLWIATDCFSALEYDQHSNRTVVCLWLALTALPLFPRLLRRMRKDGILCFLCFYLVASLLGADFLSQAAATSTLALLLCALCPTLVIAAPWPSLSTSAEHQAARIDWAGKFDVNVPAPDLFVLLGGWAGAYFTLMDWNVPWQVSLF